MANQFLKLRRSAVPGRIPSTSSLDFGEIALNTYDGLAFIKKSGSAGEEIVAIGSNTTSITGSQYFVPLFNSTSSLITSSIYQSGSFIAINATGSIHPEAPETFLVNSLTDSYNLISGHADTNGYVQLNIKNFNTGTSASADIVATADVGNEEANYINLGINGSGYNANQYIGSALDAYLYSTGENLLIGNASQGRQIIFFNGGFNTTQNARLWIHEQGTISINTSQYDSFNPASLWIEGISGIDTYNLVQIKGDVNDYSQLALQNRSTGSSASSDIVVENNNATETTNFINLGINSSNYNITGAVGSANDAYLYSTGYHLHIGNASNYPLQFFVGGEDSDVNRKFQLDPNNQHELTGSLDISGSLTVGGTITAQTLIVQTITSSVDFVTGSTIFGSQLSNTHQFTGSVNITGSLNAPVITGSLFGTASWAQNAITASYVAAANVAGLSLFQITTGSITASVGLGNDLFLIKSGSTTYFNISSSGDTTINTNKFVVRNLTTQQPVLTVSQSVVQFATQSADPVGSADIGGILFTSTAMYIGLN